MSGVSAKQDEEKMHLLSRQWSPARQVLSVSRLSFTQCTESANLHGRLRLTAFCEVGYGAARSLAFRPLLVFGIFFFFLPAQNQSGPSARSEVSARVATC